MGKAPKSPSKNKFYANVSDGSQLKALPGGLVIIRRKKHEPINLSGFQKAQIVLRTSKVSGSKFAAHWDLQTYVNWIEARTLKLGWTPKTGRVTEDSQFNKPVGISHGKKVYTIRLVSDGRYLHAYPVE